MEYSQKAGKVDQRKAECFEGLLSRLTSVPDEQLRPVTEAIARTQTGLGRGKWVEVVHMLVTAILVVALMVLA